MQLHPNNIINPHDIRTTECSLYDFFSVLLLARLLCVYGSSVGQEQIDLVPKVPCIPSCKNLLTFYK